MRCVEVGSRKSEVGRRKLEDKSWKRNYLRYRTILLCGFVGKGARKKIKAESALSNAVFVKVKTQLRNSASKTKNAKTICPIISQQEKTKNLYIIYIQELTIWLSPNTYSN